MIIVWIAFFVYVLGVAACANIIGIWHGLSYGQARGLEHVLADGLLACVLSLIWPVSLLAVAATALVYAREHSEPQPPGVRPAGSFNSAAPSAGVPSRPPVIKEGEDGQWYLNEEAS